MEKILLTALTLILILLYHPLNRKKTKRRFSVWIDRVIPLVPITIWPYLLFIPYLIFCAVLLWLTPIFIPYILTFILTSGLSVLVWAVIPNGVTRPKLSRVTSLSMRLLKYVYTHDGDSNGFPSAHVSYTIVSTHYLAQVLPHHAILLWCIATIISISTVTTKQHYVLDLIGGLTLAILTITVVERFF